MFTYVTKISKKRYEIHFFSSCHIECRCHLWLNWKKNKNKDTLPKMATFLSWKKNLLFFQTNILLSCTLLHSWAFRQWYPTTNVQDKSSSVMVGRHFWFPPALRCDLLDAPLSLWWWRNRSCIFSSLKKRCFLKQKPMLSLPLKNWLLFLAILIKALYSFLFVFF